MHFTSFKNKNSQNNMEMLVGYTCLWVSEDALKAAIFNYAKCFFLWSTGRAMHLG